VNGRGDSEKIFSRKDAKFGVLVDRFFLLEDLKLCDLAPWREINPSSERRIFLAKARRRQGKIAKTRSLKFETISDRGKILNLKQGGSG
jgi:hypothetical protein